jgi:aquaporin Z
MYKKYIAEFIGTFALAFVVLVSVAFVGTLPMAIPVIAGLTLALFVYSIGPISGCHINPSVTLGLLSVKKISNKDAGMYIVAQLLGGLVAMFVAGMFIMISPAAASAFSIKVFMAEMLGAFFFNFGIASVVYGKAKEQMSGFVVGGSLLFGILIASLSGAAGILNPAVALALNSLTVVYALAPIVGAVVGFQVYKYIAGEK